MFKIELSKRLKTIADLVIDCDVICDIGTDHGYVPIYLVLNNIVNKAIASDVSPGPCQKALDNIGNYNLQNKISVRIGDGFESIGENECNVAIIAGMGGTLIKEIIAADLEKCKRFEQLVLQPQNKHKVLREFLFNNGFDILNEKLVYEDRKFYVVIAAKYTSKVKKVDPFYLYVGEKLIENKDPLLFDFVRKQINTCSRILSEMNNMKRKDNDAEKKQIWLKERYIKLLESLK